MIQDANVTVYVSDMDRALRFYGDALGLAVESRSGDVWAEVRAPGLTIGLHGPSPHAPVPGSRGGMSIGFNVEKLDLAMEALRAKGIAFAPFVQREGPVHLAFFADPDGNPLYLCEVQPRLDAEGAGPRAR